MKNTNIPRLPTQEEKDQIIEYLLTYDEAYKNPENREEIKEDLQMGLETAYIAVFDDYQTGGPGYVGKAMVVIWDGGTYQTETYSWHPLTKEIQRDVEIQEE